MIEYEDLNEGQRRVFHDAARAMQLIVWSHVVPVRVTRIVAEREHSFNTGTGSVLCIDSKYYIMTAWHVFAELLDSRQNGEEAYFIAGNAAVEPPVVAFEDRPNDIVLLELGGSDLASIGAMPYQAPSRWPPRQVSTDDVVLLCGLPACFRTEEDSELLFGDYSIMQPITAVAENQFALHLERENWVELGRAKSPGEGVFLGGLSGAPVFVVSPMYYELVGIVSEIGTTLPLLYIKSLAHLPRW